MIHYETLATLIHFILKFKDPVGSRHDEVVARLTMETVTHMRPDLPKDELRQVAWGAQLHDIGKVFLPDSLLSIPRPLTAVEYEMMKTHVTMGHQLAHAMRMDKIVHDCILYHHENVDGSGYLQRKTLNEIPFYARVIRVTDSYDAMTTRRSYKDPIPERQAQLELQRLAGSCYDEKIVDVFLTKVVRNVG